jgi:DNA-binding NarL/FixJ family response regulator
VEAAADLAESARLAACDPWSTDAAYAAALAAHDAAGVARTADRYRAQGRLLRAGEALVDAARMADADSDAAAARSWAAAADEVLTPIGAVGLMAPVRHLLRRRRADTPKGLGRLSRSEVSVVQLLAEGLTNAEIADRLFVSRRTVESHVSSAYRKLGTNNRVELARLVAP